MDKFITISFASTIAILLVFNFIVKAQSTTQNHHREQGAIVYDLPNTDKVIINENIPYNETSNLKMDVYYPPDFDFTNKLPVVIIVLGYSDNSGFKLVGSKFKDYIGFRSWCRVIAASGMIAITYESTNPEQDIIHLSNYLKQNSDILNIDINSIGAYTCSAHTPTTITAALNESVDIFKCIVVYNGFFLTHDFEFLNEIDSISERMGFTTPRLSEPSSWKKDIPIMVVRAGKDDVPYINESLSNFYSKALNQNLPISLINYSNGVHSFDVKNDNDTSRKIIKNTIEYWKFHLE